MPPPLPKELSPEDRNPSPGSAPPSEPSVDRQPSPPSEPSVDQRALAAASLEISSPQLQKTIPTGWPVKLKHDAVVVLELLVHERLQLLIRVTI